ncbi:non-ribosomal peptide synthetase [Lentzea flava]|uniref:Non-ribosomal peptide synthetase n=1 Tax=Lentzea flava TaxID=103732 RepID=A0ABQ2UGB5_9PSEU|nr:non-ribosomal peptide synthetase [Lentzea flava]MCP2200986.1 amino acid adenylation domain-containing protein/thioester reductase domain-containing protein [Lentzea flava]GGU27437.1 non-ribosomal peptide synthetase [Lentzea flava]
MKTNLSARQQSLLLTGSGLEQSTVHAAFDITGALDVEDLHRKAAALVGRSEALRTFFRSVEDRPVRLVSRDAELPIAVTEGDPETWLAENAAAGIDVTTAPLCRLSLCRVAENHHVLLAVMHRAIAGDTTPSVLVSELFGATPSVAGPDVAAEQDLLDSAAGRAAVERWAARLADCPPRTSEEQPTSATTALRLDPLDDPAVPALTALAALLHRLTGRSDVVIGLSDATADRVPVRIGLSGDPTFRELSDRVSEAVRDALEDSHIPAEVITRRMGGDVRHAQLVVDAVAQPPAVTRLPSGTTDPGEPVTLHLMRTRDGWTAVLDNAPDRWATRLAQLLTVSPDAPLSTADCIPAAEHEQLDSWSSGPRTDPTDDLVHELIARRAESDPHGIAVSFGTSTMTFRELDERSNGIAAALQARGAGPETIVGVLLRRGLDVPATLLGVLKSGAAYLPLDPSHPAERLAFMLADSDTQVLITDGNAPAGYNGDIIDLATVGTGKAATGRPHPDNAAYVLYTSGSTGRPKGVLVPHRGLSNYVRWAVDEYGFTEGGRVPLHSPVTFDLSVTSIFPAFVAGATVAILPEDVGELAAALRGAQHSVVKLTPAHLDLLSAQATASAPRLVVGGEALFGSTLRQWAEKAPDTLIVNEYGPTETVVGCCTHTVKARDAEPGPVPIGRPIHNTRLRVLDDQLRPVPIGVPGELFIGGAGVTRGYLGQPALTAERYVPDPFSGTGERLYRTGDVVRYRANGDLEYLGRTDHQVKVRGHRIEPGEVEACLERHPGVRSATVLAREDVPGDVRLVAYVVPAGPTTDLAEHVREFLPSYMAPSAYVLLDEFPLTHNGKVDRDRLPAPTAGSHIGDEPLTGLEAELMTEVAEVLGLQGIGRRDDFFDLGGHSLLLARLSARLSARYSLDLPIELFFRRASVAGLARLIEVYQADGREAAIASADRPDLHAEAELPPELTPEGLPLADIEQPRHVLLTGVTGFLGAFLLHALLQRTGATFHCLVRASTADEAARRVRATLSGFGIWSETDAHRIVAVPGDLEKPEFGLSPGDFDALAARIDVIYHSGAQVNFVYPYHVLKPANVDGTRTVLELACRGRAKAVHHISAIDVFVRGEDRLIRENEAPDASVAAGGYIQSKWVAEKMMCTLRDRGLPVAIYRPWVVLGHTETGVSHTTDYTCVVLKGCIQLGAGLDHDMVVNFMPVDYVSSAIAHLSRQPESFGKVFHFSNHRTAELRDVWQWVREFGYPVEDFTYHDWQRRIAGVDADNALYPVVPLLTGEHAADPDRYPEETRPRIDTTNTDAGLAGSGITCPPVDRDLGFRILTYLVESGYLPHPDAA